MLIIHKWLSYFDKDVIWVSIKQQICIVRFAFIVSHRVTHCILMLFSYRNSQFTGAAVQIIAWRVLSACIGRMRNAALRGIGSSHDFIDVRYLRFRVNIFSDIIFLLWFIHILQYNVSIQHFTIIVCEFPINVILSSFWNSKRHIRFSSASQWFFQCLDLFHVLFKRKLKLCLRIDYMLDLYCEKIIYFMCV